MATLHRPSLFRVNLGGDADFWGGDGSQWSRIADFDGKEAYVVDYLNFFSPSRGAHGALTGITTPDITDSDFDPIRDEAAFTELVQGNAAEPTTG